MRPPNEVKAVIYPVDGNETVEYNKPVYCPVNGILAKTLKKDEEVKVIYIQTAGENSEGEKNKANFIDELEGINSKIGAVLSYERVDMDFLPTKGTYNKLLTDLADKIPEDAEIFADITYGFKPEILSLFCALRFVEQFREALVQYIVYGKVEFNKITKEIEHPMIFDITSLYYLFKLIGSMDNTDAETASKVLKEFFAL